MGTDSREAKSLDNMQIFLVGVYTQGRIWIGSLAFYLPFLGKRKSSCSHHQGSRNRYHIIFGFISSWFRREFIVAMSILIFYDFHVYSL
jgi:hypothetical protein